MVAGAAEGVLTMAQQVRPDFERIRAARNESRSAERLEAHFAVEARLAKQLAGSTRAERSTLYSDVYRQLFASVVDHPQHRGGTALRQDRIRRQVDYLRRMLRPSDTYLEIGCGDAGLTKAVAPFVAQAIGVDVTNELIDMADAPPAFRYLHTDGTTFELPDGSVDLVFSNQLMEHLHVEDASEQLREVFRVLRSGGRYVCSTPNRLTGPHDISCYFRYEPAGFHMREYDHRALAGLFRGVGFAKVAGSVTVKGITLNLPIGAIAPAEALFERLPVRLRNRIALMPIVSNTAGVTLIGTK